MNPMTNGHTMRLICMLVTLGVVGTAPVHAAELVLFEAAGCVWCETWHAQIGDIYPKTEEARFAPLRRVDIHGERPTDLADIRGIVYTPTFVLIEDGEEIGRITGYAGEEFFWGLLEIELKKLGERTRISQNRAPSGSDRGDVE